MVDATGKGYVGDARRDEPRQVIIVVDQPITNGQAIELGKVLGANGFTGRFVGGTVAELVAAGARLRSGVDDG